MGKMWKISKDAVSRYSGILNLDGLEGLYGNNK